MRIASTRGYDTIRAASNTRRLFEVCEILPEPNLAITEIKVDYRVPLCLAKLIRRHALGLA